MTRKIGQLSYDKGKTSSIVCTLQPKRWYYPEICKYINSIYHEQSVNRYFPSPRLLDEGQNRFFPWVGCGVGEIYTGAKINSFVMFMR